MILFLSSRVNHMALTSVALEVNEMDFTFILFEQY